MTDRELLEKAMKALEPFAKKYAVAIETKNFRNAEAAHQQIKERLEKP